MDKFQEAVEDCGLHDLGFEGDVFTWRNHHSRADGYMQQRLDRALANSEWRSRFPLTVVQNGDPRHSDHRLVILSTAMKETGSSSGKKPFFFEAG